MRGILKFYVVWLFLVVVFSLELNTYAQVSSYSLAAPSFQPNVTSSSTGVPVVNIVKPGVGGVSHNKYETYNVGSSGLILNNSNASGASQIGGNVVGNPNLGGSSAITILNEVMGVGVSNIGGTTEVFGGSAGVIVANPNGVNVNGARFINTPRVTLSTGSASVNGAGQVELDVSQGVVSVNGAGLDGSNVGSVDLIGKNVVVNGVVTAKDRLDVLAGSRKYNQATRQSTGTGATGSGYGIDASALGAMQAGQITLESSDKGVGVRAANNMAATVGGLSISADGKIVLGGASRTAKTSVNVESKSAGIDHYGHTKADGVINLKGQQVAVKQNSKVESETGVNIEADQIAIESQAWIDTRGYVNLTAGGLNGLITQDGSINAYGSISLSSTGQIIQSGFTQSGLDLNVDSPIVRLTNQYSKMESGGNFVANVGDFDSEGIVHSNLDVYISGDVYRSALMTHAENGIYIDSSIATINEGSFIGDTLSFEGSGTLYNINDGYLSGDQDTLLLNMASINNDGGLLSLEGDYALNVDDFDNGAGIFEVTGALDLNATGDVTNEGGKILSSGTSLDIAAGGDVTNEGEITSNSGDLNIMAGHTLYQKSGWNTGQGVVNLSAGHDVNVSGGEVIVGKDLNIKAGESYYQTGGVISTTQSLDISTRKGDFNLLGGTILAAEIDLEAGENYYQSGGILASANDLSIEASNDATWNGGLTQTGGELNVSAGSDISYHGGENIACKDINLDSGGNTLVSVGSLLSTGSNLNITTGYDFINSGGITESKLDTNINSDNNALFMHSGLTESYSNINISTRWDTLVTDGAQVNTASSLNILAGNNFIADTFGETSSYGDTNILAGNDVSIRNGGELKTSSNLNVNSRDDINFLAGGKATSYGGDANFLSDFGNFNNNGGEISSAGDTNIQVKLAINQNSGNIESFNDTNLYAGDINVEGGLITSRNSTNAIANFDFNLYSGNIESFGLLNIQAGRNTVFFDGTAIGGSTNIYAGNNFLNNNSDILSIFDMNIQAENKVLHQGGLTMAGEDLSVTASNALIHDGGIIGAFQTTSLNTTLGNVSLNAGGYVQNVGDLSINSAGNLYQDGSIITSLSNIQLTAGNSIYLNSGEIYSDIDTNLVSNNKIDFDDSRIQAGRDLNVQTESISMYDGSYEALNNVSMIASSSFQMQGGEIISSGNTTLNAQSYNLHGGDVNAWGDLMILGNGGLYAQSFKSFGSTNLISNRDIYLSAMSISQDGTLWANRNLYITGDTLTSGGTTVGSNALVANMIGNTTINGGIFKGDNHLEINSGGNIKSSMNLSSDGNMILRAGSNISMPGNFTAGRDLEVSVGGDLHNPGLMTAGRNLLINTGGSLYNYGADKISAIGDIGIIANGAVYNQQGGTIAAGNNTYIRASFTFNEAAGALADNYGRDFIERPNGERLEQCDSIECEINATPDDVFPYRRTEMYFGDYFKRASSGGVSSTISAGGNITLDGGGINQESTITAGGSITNNTPWVSKGSFDDYSSEYVRLRMKGEKADMKSWDWDSDLKNDYYDWIDEYMLIKNMGYGPHTPWGFPANLQEAFKVVGQKHADVVYRTSNWNAGVLAITLTASEIGNHFGGSREGYVAPTGYLGGYIRANQTLVSASLPKETLTASTLNPVNVGNKAPSVALSPVNPVDITCTHCDPASIPSPLPPPPAFDPETHEKYSYFNHSGKINGSSETTTQETITTTTTTTTTITTETITDPGFTGNPEPIVEPLVTNSEPIVIPSLPEEDVLDMNWRRDKNNKKFDLGIDNTITEDVAPNKANKVHPMIAGSLKATENIFKGNSVEKHLGPLANASAVGVKHLRDGGAGSGLGGRVRARHNSLSKKQRKNIRAQHRADAKAHRTIRKKEIEIRDKMMANGASRSEAEKFIKSAVGQQMFRMMAGVDKKSDEHVALANAQKRMQNIYKRAAKQHKAITGEDYSDYTSKYGFELKNGYDVNSAGLEWNEKYGTFVKKPSGFSKFLGSTIGKIVMAIVAVVVTALTMGAALTLLGPAAAASAMAAAGGALAVGGVAAGMATVSLGMGMAIAAIGGLAAGLVTGTITMAANGFQGKWFKSVALPALISAGVAAATFGVGHGLDKFASRPLLDQAGNQVISQTTGEVVKEVGWAAIGPDVLFGRSLSELTLKPALHGLVQGGARELQGGDFMDGFQTAALSSLINTGISGFTETHLQNTWLDNSFTDIGLSSLTGGAIEEINGGDFWDGAATAGSVALFNDFLRVRPDGSAEWVIEKDGLVYNKNMRDVPIGRVDGDNIIISEQFGGMTLPLDQVSTFIDKFWREYPDISNAPQAVQDHVIKMALSKMAEGYQIMTPSQFAQYSEAIASGSQTGLKANVNAAGKTVVAFMTAGKYEPTIWEPTEQDMQNGYALSEGFARVGYEVLSGVLTGGAAKALSSGGKLVSVAGKGIVVLDATGNTVASGEGIADITLNGVSASNVLQTVAGVGGLGGNVVGDFSDAFRSTTRVDVSTPKTGALTRQSVDNKLSGYLLNKSHPVGESKAKWFDDALGFTTNNSEDLAKQIVFNSKTAVPTGVTQYGTKYNQIINIVGANGKQIPVNFAWIKNNDGVVRLVTGIPTPK